MSDPEEIFPINMAAHLGAAGGARVALGPHYGASLRRMGYDPDRVPGSLFYTFCGDLLGSIGEHYVPGTGVDFATACTGASLSFSDDFMESLAMHAMPRPPADVTLPMLMEYRDIFLAFIRDHFEAMSLTYSPWFGALFAARTEGEFGDILLKHGSCGAAMRAAVLAQPGADGTVPDDAAVLPYFLMTHAHLEAIEGAYIVLGMARAALAGHDFSESMKIAEQAGRSGRRLCQGFQAGQGWPVQDFAPLMPQIARVLDSGDAYAPIHNLAAEGIETRFVVPAALLCLRDALDCGPDDPESVRRGVERLVVQGLKIGGDPDTICSIAMGLYGLFRPACAAGVLAGVEIGADHDGTAI